MANNRKERTAAGRFAKGNKGGRSTPNKLTASAKVAFQHAFDAMGGADTLAAWAKDNPGDFYKLFARLIPTEQRVDATVEGAHYTLFVPAKGSIPPAA